MKLLSIVTPCFNEEGNVEEVYKQVKQIVATLPGFNYEHIFIDNASADRTAEILRELASKDRNVKVILNNRNFGHIRSPYHALLQSSGDAVILLVADLQDPPAMIRDFVREWEGGNKVVLGVKSASDESAVMFAIRKLYYDFISRVSETELTKNNTGFGLYDRKVIETLRTIDDSYPYFRGLISELGFKTSKLSYHQPARHRGVTSNNFYRLYDIAMLGITNHSKVPLRVAAMMGFLMSVVFFLIAVGYLVAKLIFWNEFQLGFAPLLVGIFFFSSVQLLFTGVLGEYIGSIHTQVLKRPLVVEKERINF
jgi:glycosyltransferase involved in cell wall biosynthesis